MAPNQSLIRALVQKEIEVLRQKRAVFDAAGLKVDVLEQALVKLLADTIGEDARQEFLKAEGLKATQRTTTSYRKLYVKGSGTLDAMMGVLGKDSEEAKVLGRMRSQAQRPGEGSEDASPLPVEPAQGAK